NFLPLCRRGGGRKQRCAAVGITAQGIAEKSRIAVLVRPASQQPELKPVGGDQVGLALDEVVLRGEGIVVAKMIGVVAVLPIASSKTFALAQRMPDSVNVEAIKAPIGEG